MIWHLCVAAGLILPPVCITSVAVSCGGGEYVPLTFIADSSSTLRCGGHSMMPQSLNAALCCLEMDGSRHTATCSFSFAQQDCARMIRKYIFSADVAGRTGSLESTTSMSQTTPPPTTSASSSTASPPKLRSGTLYSATASLFWRSPVTWTPPASPPSAATWLSPSHRSAPRSHSTSPSLRTSTTL